MCGGTKGTRRGQQGQGRDPRGQEQGQQGQSKDNRDTAETTRARVESTRASACRDSDPGHCGDILGTPVAGPSRCWPCQGDMWGPREGHAARLWDAAGAFEGYTFPSAARDQTGTFRRRPLPALGVTGRVGGPVVVLWGQRGGVSGTLRAPEGDTRPGT